MPRYYERKTTRGDWSTNSMEQALHALDEGQPLLVCEKNFGVPRNTLRRHWLKTVKKVPGSRHLGRESLLGPVVEADLVQYILMVEERGFGLTPTDVRVLAFDYAESQNIPHKFDKNLKIAGKDWWAGFRLRHRELLSIRKPEGLSISRASAMNRPAIEKYFNVLENEMRRLGLTNKPGCIYNCDESGLSLVPDTCKIVGRKGKKNIYQVTSAERGVLTTVLPCYNASGYYMPPMVIFKGKRLSDGLKSDMPDGTLVSISDTGYMSKELFQVWLKHFKKHLQDSSSPALLILDGHGSHVKAIEGLKFAEQNNISIICLPPHTTHWTQPQDRSYFKPLKSNYAHECRKFMREHPGRAITRYDFGKLFTAAYQSTSTMAIAVQSFRATGIYPLNKDIFGDDVFSPADTTDRPIPRTGEQGQNGDGSVAAQGQTSGGNDGNDGAQGQNGGGEKVSVQSQASGGREGQTVGRSDVAQGQTSDGNGGNNGLQGQNGLGIVALHSQASGGSEDQDQTVGGSDAAQSQISGGDSRNDGEFQSSNRFELMKPMPKKVFCDKKGNAKSRATTSRVLTGEKHLSSLQEELRLSADKASKINKRKQPTQNTKGMAVQKRSELEKAAKKKKLTCREDKQRGMKRRRIMEDPKMKKATKGKAKLDKKADVTATEIICCAGCGEPENESTEPWIGCCICKAWYEVSCAGMLGKAKDIQDAFVCIECQ